MGDSGRVEAAPDNQVKSQTIGGIVQRWAQTLLSRDLDAHMSLYAAKLDRFGGRRGVNREVVRSEKEQLLAAMANVRRFEIHDLRLIEDKDTETATAYFRIDWKIDGGVSDAAPQRLVFRKVDGRWLIVGEELPDLQSRNADRVVDSASARRY